jgi:maleylpyruvate isomerase
MKLHNYWRSSSSYRVRLALEHKHLEYVYVAVNLLQGEQHQPAHRARNPSGMVPVLEVEEDGRTLFVPQSVAIVEYLEERYPERPLFPSSRADRAQMRALVESITGGIQPFHNLATLNYVKSALAADPTAWATHFIDAGLSALEQLAARSAGTYLVGDAFTWADCCLVPQLFGARRFATFDASRYPLLARVEATCLALPAVQRARPEAQPDAQR